MLWPFLSFFEGNQRSIKRIAAYIESFPCGKPAGYKLKNQRGINNLARSKGMFFRKTRLYPPWLVYKVATGIPVYRGKGYSLYRELYMGAFYISGTQQLLLDRLYNFLLPSQHP